MTPRDGDGSFTHMHGVMHLLPTGVKKVHCGMAWILRTPCFLFPMYQITGCEFCNSSELLEVKKQSCSMPEPCNKNTQTKKPCDHLRFMSDCAPESSALF